MELPGNSGSGNANLPPINEELTYSVLTSQARRKLLVALAVGGPQNGVDLKHVGRGNGKCTGDRVFTQSTLANLKKMVQAGIVLQHDHPTDGRRVLYSLSPLVKVTKEGDARCSILVSLWRDCQRMGIEAPASSVLCPTAESTLSAIRRGRRSTAV